MSDVGERTRIRRIRHFSRNHRARENPSSKRNHANRLRHTPATSGIVESAAHRAEACTGMQEGDTREAYACRKAVVAAGGTLAATNRRIWTLQLCRYACTSADSSACSSCRLISAIASSTGGQSGTPALLLLIAMEAAALAIRTASNSDQPWASIAHITPV